MASPRILSISRTLFSKQTLTSLLLPRSFTSSSLKSAPSFSVAHLRHLAGIHLNGVSPAVGVFRTFSTRQAQSSLNDNSPNWSNRPPKETILLDGCDFEHWLVVTEPPPENATRDEIIDSYVKTLSQIVGSEEEARMKIYSVSTRCYFAFGALVSEELSYKLKELPNVRWVLPDSYLDVRNKDYGGEPFIDGQAVPYDPKYHEEWIRNNQKAQDRNRRNDRPRNNDRSRNFERRQRTPGPGFQSNNPNPGPGFQSNNPNPGPGFQNNPNPGPNMAAPGGNLGGPPPPNMSPNQPHGPPNPGYSQNNPGYGQNMQQNNSGGYGQNMPRDNQGGYPPNNPGFNQGPPNSGPPNYQGQGNPGFQANYQGQGARMPYQNSQMPPQGNMGGGNFAPQGNMGVQNGGGNFAPQGNMPDGGGAYQGQDVPGRDMPRYQ